MARNVLGKTGLLVSRLGFGAAPVGMLATNPTRVSRILDQLLEAGVNLIDTAECYGDSEELLGTALRRRRDQFVLVTKCGHRVPGLKGREWSPSLITQSVDRSLRRLKTDCIDVLLLHSCDLKTLRRGDVVDAVVKAREGGKVRFAGYSGDNEAAAFAASLAELSVIETSISLCDQENIAIVLPVARQGNLGVIAKRPLANAAWLAPEQHEGLYKEYARAYVERLREMNLTPEDLGFRGKAERTWPEIALRFTLSVPGVHAAIVGTTHPERVEANAAAASKGPLAASVMRSIRTAFRRAEKRSNQNWPALT